MSVDVSDIVIKILQISEFAGYSIDERIEAMNTITKAIKIAHPNSDPISSVQWVPADSVIQNQYNPNNVAPPEMKLLYKSILEDGYTQPIVTFWDEKIEKYVVVDGFHRNRVGKEYKDIRERIHGYLPIVTIDKSIANRKASTIRHNRARGKHSVTGMTDIVVGLVQEAAWTDEEISERLGMDADEVLRLKQVSGIPELFKNREYSRSWILDPNRVKQRKESE